MSTLESNTLQGEVMARGKYRNYKVVVPIKIRNMLWIQSAADDVQVYIETDNKRAYITKSDPRGFFEHDAELLYETKLWQGKMLTVTAPLRDRLWLEDNNYLEYLSDPNHRDRFYLRRED